MKRTAHATVHPAAPTAASPNRLLLILAAAWMAVAIAMGGVLAAEPASDTVAPVTGVFEPAQR